MEHRLCPWWFAYFFDNALRGLFHKPEKILGFYIAPGMTVMDIGCGMGHFSIGMARMVGDSGRVYAVDLQAKMLDVLVQRARKAGVEDRIQTWACAENSIGLDVEIDLALCIWMVHEVPEADALFRDLHRMLKPGGRVIIAEPLYHVSDEEIDEMRKIALANGFREEHPPPRIRFSHSVVLTK